jgi:hypothetical protein
VVAGLGDTNRTLKELFDKAASAAFEANQCEMEIVIQEAPT